MRPLGTWAFCRPTTWISLHRPKIVWPKAVLGFEFGSKSIQPLGTTGLGNSFPFTKPGLLRKNIFERQPFWAFTRPFAGLEEFSYPPNLRCYLGGALSHVFQDGMKFSQMFL